MKLKIRSRLLLLTIFIIIFSFLVQVLFNVLFLDKYYQMKRKEKIISIGNNLLVKDYNENEISEIENKNSVQIDYYRINNIKKVSQTLVAQEVDGVIKTKVKKELQPLEDKSLLLEESLGAKFISYYVKKEDVGYIRVRANSEEMLQAIDVANRFSIYSAMVAFVFGILLSIIFGKDFLEPIYKINKKIKSLAKLDFNENLALNSGDEFQELSENINFVSNELENKIQDLKIANSKLKEDINREKRFEQKRREFISNVTHEIKTPITVINTYAESLAEGYVTDDEKRKYYSNIIIEEGQNITKLVDDLLKIIKNEYDNQKLNGEEFDLVALIKKEMEKFKIDLVKKEVRYSVEGVEKAIVKADKEKIGHVINNFLSNGVSYVPQKGIFKINIIREQGKFLISFENNGKKIKEENIEEVWKPFFKEDRSRSRKYGGTGLGLSIVRELLNAHKSRHGVVNTESGVKFWFELEEVKILDKKTK